MNRYLSIIFDIMPDSISLKFSPSPEQYDDSRGELEYRSQHTRGKDYWRDIYRNLASDYRSLGLERLVTWLETECIAKIEAQRKEE